MKKIILIVFLIVSLIGCRDPFNGSGFITDKGIDKIDVQALMNGIQIKNTDSDIKYIEMYWIRLNTCEDKIYINLFSYEDMEKGEFVILRPEHSDIRFETEY